MHHPQPKSVLIDPTSEYGSLSLTTMAFLMNELVILLCITMLPQPAATAHKLHLRMDHSWSTLAIQV